MHRVPTLKAQSPIIGNTEMATRIRAFPWETTPLGPIDAWSPTLINTVNLALAANFPVQLLWGPQFILLHNDAWIPLLMDRADKALGQPGAVFWSEVWSLVKDELHGVLERGISTSHRDILLPVLRNGVVEDVYWDYTYNPVYTPDGEVVAVMNISQDVTDTHVANQKRHEAEVALRAERARLLNVLQQAPIFFALLEGPAHRFTMVNPLYTKLIGGRSVVGKTVREALPEVIEQGYVSLLDKVFSIGESFTGSHVSVMLAPADGQPPEERILDFVYQPLREANGKVSGIIVIGVDITERKQAESALLQSEKLAAVGRLAASIAHEINNPLEAVTNLLYIARNSNSMEEVRGFLATADDELRRVSAIANQTLRFHRQSSRAVEVSCDSLIGSVVSIYTARLANAHIKVEKRKRAVNPVVCFEGDIRQVINNLIGNAIDAMTATDTRRLLLRSRDATDWKTGRKGLAITVADTGIGIPAAALTRIFEPFFTTKGINGTGLGLWISTEIVQRHHGRLLVKSSQSPEHHGTVFTLFLPYNLQNELRIEQASST